jgi:hypothetical protein
MTWRPRGVAAMAGPCVLHLTARRRAGLAPGKANLDRVEAAGAETPNPAGRPKVKLNRLTFPSMPEASYYKTRLKRISQHAAPAADWGADSGSLSSTASASDTLDIETNVGLRRVRCAVAGEPRGRGK